MFDGAGIHESSDGFVSGDDHRQRDHRDDEQAGQIFDAPEPVGVAARGSPGAHREGDPERYRGEGIREVVNRVGGQCNRARYGDDAGLCQRGDAQDHQADLHCSDTRSRRFERGIDAVGGVMGMRREDLGDHPVKPCRCGWSW